MQALAARFGVAVSRYPPPHSLARHLREVFGALEITCVLDVGAHQGEYAEFLRNEVGFRGLVVSFEPQAEPFAVMQRRRAADPGWRGHAYALGADHGTREMVTFGKSRLSSFRRPTALIERFTPGPPVIARVKIRRLDSILDGLLADIRHPRLFMKMDTQGFDLEVLKGAQEALPRILGLQSEVSVKPLYEHMPDLHEAITTMTGLGFELTGLFPVTREGLGLIELDAVLARPSRAAPGTA